ncbi:MAG: ParA family protein [Acidobacteriota bacterium]
MRVAFVNVKGGVGKTTSAVSAASALQRSGLKVMLVDLDPQASATYSLGFRSTEGSLTVADVLLDGTPAQEVVVEAENGVHVLPGSMELAAADLKLARQKTAAQRLDRALQGSESVYDAVIIDCPPGLSLLTLMGLRASKAYVVPSSPQDLAIDALGRFFQGLETLESEVGETQLLGILITMADWRVRHTDEMVKKLRKAYGKKVFSVEIPINVKLAEASGYGVSIFELESWSTGGAAYRKFSGEMLRRLRTLGLN